MHRLLVANRGEIACRVIRSARTLGIATVAVHSSADRGAMHTRLADRSVCIGPAAAGASYLNADALLAAATGTGCDAVHPGYGFLSENAAFAARVVDAGLTFVGPSAGAIEAMGDKARARRIAVEAGVPVVPGVELGHLDAPQARAQLIEAGVSFPVLLKAVAGGGGRGIRVVRDPPGFDEALAIARAEALAAFGDGALYAERFLSEVRHVEVQVLCDAHGVCIALGERDCTIQRRFQKILEEAPSPAIDDRLRLSIENASLRLCRRVDYQGAGTLEFLYEAASGRAFFIEMNTRIQVEHPLTEMLTGVDLVAQQLRIARGERLDPELGRIRTGHAFECRINAEDPQAGFRPVPGRIGRWQAPPTNDDVRLDTHCEPGSVVPPYYDSLLGKLVVRGTSREVALARLVAALDAFEIDGIATTLGLHRRLVRDPNFRAVRTHTRWLESLLAGDGAATAEATGG